MKTAVATCCLIALSGLSGVANAKAFFQEDFSAPDLSSWTLSTEWKPLEEMGTWDVTSGDWFADEAAARGMRVTQDARFYGISKPLETPVSNKDSDLVIQFSVKHEKRPTSFCAGGYLKLLPEGTDLASFGGDTEYLAMFGPDLCGYDVSRVHAIVNYDGTNSLRAEDVPMESAIKDAYTHLYTWVIHPDNAYEIYIDLELKAEGSLASDWSEIPSKTIDDPNDSKPSDWVDERLIDDPEHVKPDGYDDVPEFIEDADATKPEDWDDDEDGEWTAPEIPNPEYLGPWEQRTIENPDYVGEFKPKQIPNPEYDPNAYAFGGRKIGAVGFELWVVNGGSIFSNIYVGDSFFEAKELAEETFVPFVQAERDAKKVIDDAEAERKAQEAEVAAAAAEAEAEAERESEGEGEDEESFEGDEEL